MKTKTKILIVSILFCLSIVGLLFVIGKDKDTENNNSADDESEYYVIDEEIVNDLKENLGKGTNGDVVNVENTYDKDGNRQYIYTFSNGNTETLTIHHDDNYDSGVSNFTSDDNEKINPGDNKEDVIDADDDQEDINNPDDGQEDITDPDDGHEDIDNPEDQEDLGTVYERFLAMSSEMQFAFYETFDSHEEYMEWYRKAQSEFLALHPTIEIGDGDYIVYGE